MTEKAFHNVFSSLEVLENEEFKFLASSPLRTFGSFIPELSLVQFEFTELEIDSLIAGNSNALNLSEEKFALLRSQFVQAWFHEYHHFYQQVAVPSMRTYSRLRKNKLKIETAILIMAAEMHNSWDVSDNKNAHIWSVLESGEFIPPLPMKDEFEQQFGVYRDNIGSWNESKKHGISCNQLVEGMAHFFSRFSGSLGFVDVLGLERNPIYTRAFNVFLEKGGKNIDGELLRAVVFCYFCYFSLQKVTPENCVGTFIDHCEKIPVYFQAMRNPESQDFVTKVIKRASAWLNCRCEIRSETLKTLGLLMAFVSLLKQETAKQLDKNDLLARSDYTEDEKAIADYALPESEAAYQDYHLLLFFYYPDLFWKWSSRLRKTEDVHFMLGDKQVSLRQEQELAKFVLNFRSLINANRKNSWCCSEHEYKGTRSSIVFCENADSFATIFNQLTRAKLSDCLDFS